MDECKGPEPVRPEVFERDNVSEVVDAEEGEDEVDMINFHKKLPYSL